MQSVLARGARRSKSRFGTALDLFASGTAEIYTKPGRELQTLAAFDVARSRGQLAGDLERFTAASAIAELAMRFATGESHMELYDALVATFDSIGDSPGDTSVDAALGGAWHLVGQLGFAPVLDDCASCHTPIPGDAVASFSHPAGGVLCGRCATLAGNAASCRPRRAPRCARGSRGRLRESLARPLAERISDCCASSCRSTSPMVVPCAPTTCGSASRLGGATEAAS